MDAARLIEVDWELGIFRAIRALVRQLRPAPPPPFDPARAAQLLDHQGTLSHFASLIAGEPLRVLPAKEAGGVRGRDVLMPSFIDLASDPEANRGLYILRAAHAGTVRRLRLDAPVPTERLARERATLRATDLAARALMEELPSFSDAWHAACLLALAVRPPLHTLRGQRCGLEQARQRTLSGEPIWADDAFWAQLATARADDAPLPPVPLWGALLSADQEGSISTPPDQRPPDGKEVAAPPIEEVHRILQEPKEAEQAVLIHTFEKVETLDTFDGQKRDLDGDDDLDDHLEALEEVDLKDLIRGGEQAHSVYRAEIGLEADIPDVATVAPNEKGIPYDEWDLRQRGYRKGWCTVYPSAIPRRNDAWATAATQQHRHRIAALERALRVFRASRQPAGRQREGEDVDLSAVVDHLAEVAAGRTGSDRLYLRTEPRRRRFATTVLLDVSLSADAWVADRRVLDVGRESVLILGEVAHALGDAFSVMTFASATRNRCRVWQVKSWRESWPTVRGRLGAIEPQGYTRIGPALRHATADLLTFPADHHLLLVLTDGKPTDYDRYEGRYGLADVRMAVREAERAGVTLQALSLDASTRPTLPALFGPGGWHILSSPDQLLDVLTTVYGRFTVR